MVKKFISIRSQNVIEALMRGAGVSEVSANQSPASRSCDHSGPIRARLNLKDSFTSAGHQWRQRQCQVSCKGTHCLGSARLPGLTQEIWIPAIAESRVQYTDTHHITTHAKEKYTGESKEDYDQTKLYFVHLFLKTLPSQWLQLQLSLSNEIFGQIRK